MTEPPESSARAQRRRRRHAHDRDADAVDGHRVEPARAVDEVDHPVDHRGSHLFNGLGLRIKRRSGRTNNGTALSYRFHVIDVNETQRCVARHKNEFSSFFEHHVCGTGNEIVADAGCDPGQGAHAARANDEGVVPCGTGCKRRIKIVFAVCFKRILFIIAVTKFVKPHVFGVVAHHQAHFFALRGKVF